MPTSRWVRRPRTSPISYGITREEMDTYALNSHQRAVTVGKDGTFACEIIPVLLAPPYQPDDDGPGRTPRSKSWLLCGRRSAGRPSHRRQRLPAQ